MTDSARLVTRVHQLYGRYCFSIDTFDIDAYVNTFAEDGSLEVYGGPTHSGRTDIHQWANNRMGKVLHLVSNVLVGQDEDRGLVSAAYFSLVSRETGIPIAYGLYEDDIANDRTTGGICWQRKRVFYITASEAHAEGLGVQPGNLPEGYQPRCMNRVLQ
jgi:hypothetical protein